MQLKIIYRRILPLTLIVFIAAGCNKLCRNSTDQCATKYPVLLVHGIAFKDKTTFLRYWGEIPGELKKNGAVVFTGNQPAFDTIEHNAGILKKRVNEILKETGAERVNIIAHSRGGLEARYMISKLGMEKSVATLTTLATPHQGSTIADYILKKPSKKIVEVIFSFYARILGDKDPQVLNAGRELTPESMKAFNVSVKDSPLVYYQSYAGAINKDFSNKLWVGVYEKIAEKEGANDGLVSVESAKWGKFRGVADCEGKARVTHADIIGLHQFSGDDCFKAGKFFVNLVHDLKNSGY